MPALSNYCIIAIKSTEDEQTLAELNSAHRHLQAKFHLVQTSYIKRMKVAQNSFLVFLRLIELGVICQA